MHPEKFSATVLNLNLRARLIRHTILSRSYKFFRKTENGIS